MAMRFYTIPEELVGQLSQNGAQAITKWKNGSIILDVTIFDSPAEDLPLSKTIFH